MKRKFDLIFENTMKFLNENAEELTEDLAEESNENEAEAQVNEEQEQIDEDWIPRGLKQWARFSLTKGSQYQKDFADYTKDMNIAMKNSGFETLPDKPYIWKRKIGNITIYVQFSNPMALLKACEDKGVNFKVSMLKMKVFTKDMKAKGRIPKQNIKAIGTATTEDQLVKNVIQGAINCGLDEKDAKKYILSNKDSVNDGFEDFDDDEDEAPKKKKKAPVEELDDDSEEETDKTPEETPEEKA